MKKVYICSPCRGDYENNIQRAREFSRAAVLRGCIPITPHVYLTQFMDDTIPEERALALTFGLELVLLCDELWAFGLDKPTEGMAGEISLAKQAGIPVINGYKAISVMNPDTDDPKVIMRALAEGAREYSRRRIEPMMQSTEAKVGKVTLHVPGFIAMARCNEHLNRKPFDFEIDGNIILELAERLKANPGESFEVSGGGTA